MELPFSHVFAGPFGSCLLTIARSRPCRANRRAVKVLEDIGDQMREIYEKAGSGEIAAESQPLLDAVAVLLDSIIAQSGGNVTKN